MRGRSSRQVRVPYARFLSAMRASRLAPWCALLVTAAAAVVAVASSRAEDWQRPLILVLIAAFALIADRNEVLTPTGSAVVATHPAFVLAMVLLGPAPALAIGMLVVVTNPASTKARVASNAAVYAVF